MRFRLMCWIARRIVIYRPEYIQTIAWSNGWLPTYTLGPLRAKVFGIRIPILWAWDWMCFAGVIKPLPDMRMSR